MKNIVFRVDSSTQIGSGHVMRCLTLAHSLKAYGKILFICRNLPGNVSCLVEKNGFQLFLLPTQKENQVLEGYLNWLTVTQEFDALETIDCLKSRLVDLLIVDHYAIDYIWENHLRLCVDQIMVIDDLANRKHDCDILLDQNYYENMEDRYKEYVSIQCRLLLGPEYVLLRDEFRHVVERKNRTGDINNILVFFGGSDPSNETLKTLQAIKNMQLKNTIVNVVIGGCNPRFNEIEDFCSVSASFHCFSQINYMAELMNQADLAIGAGGGATWERCFLGIPSIVIAIAENQIKLSEDCSRRGFLEYIGLFSNVNTSKIQKSIMKFIDNKFYYQQMAIISARLVDGMGVMRTVKQILR